MLRFSQALENLGSVFVPGMATGRDTALIAPIRDAARQLCELSSETLRERSEQVRIRVAHETTDAERARIEAFAIMCEALRRTCRIELYDVQLLASLVLARGAIAEMQTGEGKTLACAPAGYLHALTGCGVHVATPNSYLAKRDYDQVLPAYRMLGISVGLLPERASASEKRPAYRCDVTYGTGYEFGFDYLRDQLTLRQASHRVLGERILENLADASAPSEPLIQRRLCYAIVDEADQVLLDDAASPLILSGATQGEAADAEVHRAALQMLGNMSEDEHFRVDSTLTHVELTEAGVASIHGDEHRIPFHLLRRTWREYVEQALQAALLRRDVHYVVNDTGEVQIVDTGTGRIFSDRTWRDGLHQAVEAKEGVRITPEKHALAQITRQRFYRLYQRLAGMTGTAAGGERELREVYRLAVEPIPLRTPSRRELWPARLFSHRQAKWNAIADSVADLHAQQRPVLVGTRSIVDSEQLADLFRERGIAFELLNGRQDASEASVVAQAGQRGAVTIATSLAGRGTDIKLGPGVADLGGLHVVVSECNDSTRIDRQLIGRCARQGDPGSAQIFVSGDDPLIQRYGPWLDVTISRLAGPDGELRANLNRQIRRIQRAVERAAYGSRCILLRRDMSRDSLYSRQSIES